MVRSTKKSDVSVTEARTHLSRLLWQVQLGRESIRITRRGKAVAVLAPVVEQSGNWITALLELRDAYPEEMQELGEELDWIYRERRRRLCPYDMCPVDGQPSLPPME